MPKILSFPLIVLCALTAVARAENVSIAYDKATRQAAYAARRLGVILAERGYSLKPPRGGNDFHINLEVVRSPRATVIAWRISGQRTSNPASSFRAIKYNVPWDTYRTSSALDQHYATARDIDIARDSRVGVR